MANSDLHTPYARDPDLVFENGNFTSVDGGSPTVFGGCIKTITRTGEGTFTGTLKRKYKQFRWGAVNPLLAAGGWGVVSACDPVAGTFALVLSTVAGAADDLPTADVRVTFWFANTTQTRR